MADRIQIDGKTFVPLIEGAGVVGVSEKDVRALGLSGKVFLRAIGKKIYVDLDGLRAAVQAPTALTATPAVPASVTAAPAPIVRQAPLSPVPPMPITARTQAPQVQPTSPSSPPLPAQIPVPVQLQKPVAPAEPLMRAPVMKMDAAQQVVHPAAAPVPLQPKPVVPTLPPRPPLVPQRHHATSSGELAAMSVPVPLPVLKAAPAALAAAAVPAPAPVVAPVAASGTTEQESSVINPAAVSPVPAGESLQAAAVPPVVQPKPTTAATATPAPSVLPKMILPPREMMSRRTSFATTAAAMAAFVFVVGGGVAAYSKAPVIAQMMRQAGEQIAAAAGFSPSATYTIGEQPGAHFSPDSPSTNQANASAATFPGSSASSTQPIYYVYNYPVIERVVEEVRYINAETPQDWQAQLDALYQRIQSQIQALNINTSTNFAQQYQVIAHTNNIDQLGGVRISDSTFTGGTITGSTLTDIASLDVDGSTTLGSLSVGDITGSGGGTFSGAGTFSYLVASSTNATSTFNGALLATRAPTVPHTFSSWTTGASNSAWWDAALVINPATAVADSNLFSAAVNGDVKFLIDAEGDVFVNNLTSVGSVTLSTTSASTFTVEGNTTLGDSITDTTTINGSLVVTGTTTVSTVSGRFGVGTTSPWAKLAVQGTAGQTYPLFQVASSSDSTAYLTVTSSGSIGIGTTSPWSLLSVAGSFTTTGTNTFSGALNIAGAITSTATSANIFPYASSTALTVSGLAHFGIASTTQLSVFDRAYFGGSATSTFDSLGNLYIAGSLGVGTSSPLRKFAVENAASAAQFAVAYDTTRVTEIQTDSSGDVVIDPSGSDVRLNDDNLWVCTGGACPSGTPSGTGNLIVETKLGVGTSTPWGSLSVDRTSGTTDPIGLLSARIGSFTSSVLRLENSLDPATSYNFIEAVADSDNDSTGRSTRFVVRGDGSVGIGTTSPSAQLAISEELFVGAGGASTMGTATSTFYGDIRIIGKLDVSTIDPVYTIDGIKYATYGHSTVGIKEEVVLKLTPTVWDAQKQMYAHVIDFDSLEKGSDLWLFYQVSDFGKNWQNLIASLSPAFDGRTYYEEDVQENTLTIYASDSKPVSLRLIASRYDFTKWGNLRPDQDGDTEGTHVIGEK